MMSGCLLPDIGKAPTKRFNKKTRMTFLDMNFLEENGEKIFERLHMPLNQKMKFVQKK
jgi:tRNA nucleotidyltransferase (CCA-adding enzyme)